MVSSDLDELYGTEFCKYFSYEFAQSHLRINLTMKQFDKEIIKLIVLEKDLKNKFLSPLFWINITDKLDNKFTVERESVKLKYTWQKVIERFFVFIFPNHSSYKLSKTHVKKLTEVIGKVFTECEFGCVNDFLTHMYNAYDYDENIVEEELELLGEIEEASNSCENGNEFVRKATNTCQENETSEDSSSNPDQNTDELKPNQADEENCKDVSNDKVCEEENIDEKIDEAMEVVTADDNENNELSEEDVPEKSAELVNEAETTQVDEEMINKSEEETTERDNIPRTDKNSPELVDLDLLSDLDMITTTQGKTSVAQNLDDTFGKDEPSLVIDEGDSDATEESDSTEIAANEELAESSFKKQDQVKLSKKMINDDDRIKSKYFIVNENSLNLLSAPDSIEKTKKYIRTLFGSKSKQNEPDVEAEPSKPCARKKIKLRQKEKVNLQCSLTEEELLNLPVEQPICSVDNSLNLSLQARVAFETIYKHNKSKGSYNTDEDSKILNFIIRNQRYADIKGNQLWKEMEEASVCIGRSWQSMKERFRKTITTNMHMYSELFGITSQQMEYLQMNIQFVPPQTKNEQKTPAEKIFGSAYTVAEDEEILKMIFTRDGKDTLLGKALWIKISKHFTAKVGRQRSWQSLRERFIKRILPKLYKYQNLGTLDETLGVAEECVRCPKSLAEIRQKLEERFNG